MKFFITFIGLVVAFDAAATPAPLVSIPTHDAFFDSIKQHCGKAFEGKVVFDNDPSPAFQNRLVMHVRACTDTQLQIPFHFS